MSDILFYEPHANRSAILKAEGMLMCNGNPKHTSNTVGHNHEYYKFEQFDSPTIIILARLKLWLSQRTDVCWFLTLIESGMYLLN